MRFVYSLHSGKYGIAVFLFAITTAVYGQEEIQNSVGKEVTVKKRTVLERFDTDLVISPEERMKLKLDRMAAIQKRLEIIDTLNISTRQRRKLLKELYRSPFSNEWNKVIADLEFEEIAH